jgi:hypothetical protein
MRRYLPVVLLAIFLVVPASRSAQLGIIGAWLFDDAGNVVADSVGSNDGSLEGTAKWAASGKTGGGVELPGKGDSFIRIPYAPEFNSDNYTFMCWTKLTPGNWQYIVWRDGEVWPEPENLRRIDIWINLNTNAAVYICHAANGEEIRGDGTTAIADEKWHHVAKTFDGSMLKMYIDGNLEVESDVGGQLVVNEEADMWIGARPGDVSATGIFDEVGYSTEALGEEDIATIMNQGLGMAAAVAPAGKLPIAWGYIK